MLYLRTACSIFSLKGFLKPTRRWSVLFSPLQVHFPDVERVEWLNKVTNLAAVSWICLLEWSPPRFSCLVKTEGNGMSVAHLLTLLFSLTVATLQHIWLNMQARSCNAVKCINPCESHDSNQDVNLESLMSIHLSELAGDLKHSCVSLVAWCVWVWQIELDLNRATVWIFYCKGCTPPSIKSWSKHIFISF